MKLHRELLFVIVGRYQSVQPAMAKITNSHKIAGLFAASDWISQVMDLGGRPDVINLANSTGEADDLEAKVIPPLGFLVGGFEFHFGSPLLGAAQ